MLIKSILEELEGLCSDNLNIITEEVLDEKIMSKKKARKLKKQKQAKAKKAQQQKEKQLQAQINQANEPEVEDDVIEAEVVDEDEEVTTLVKYEDTEPNQEELTEAFKKIMNDLSEICNKHYQDIKRGMDMWKQAGEDGACPQDAWDLMYNSLGEFKQNIDNELNTYLQDDKTTQAELTVVEQLLTAVDGYVKQSEQQLMGAKPNLVEDDFKAPATQDDGGDIVAQNNQDTANSTGTALVPAGSTALTTTGSTQIATNDNKKTKSDDTKNKRQDLVNYHNFSKGWTKTLGGLEYIIGILPKMVGINPNTLKDMALNMFTWFDNKIFAMLTSRLATDIVKTFMYLNPITAMIFDGDFGSFSLKDGLNKIRDKINKKLQDAKPSNRYSKRGLLKPEVLDKMNVKQMKKEFFGNKDMVDLINISFNHKQVALTTDNAITKGFKKAGKAVKDALMGEAFINEDGENQAPIATIVKDVTGTKVGKRNIDKYNGKKLKFDDGEVTLKQKGALKKYVADIKSAFEKTDAGKARTNFKAILKLLNEICDNLSWETPKDWRGLWNNIIKKRGNTDREQNVIDKKKNKTKSAKSKVDQSLLDKVSMAIKQNPKITTKEMSKLLDGKYADDIVTKYMDMVRDTNESYNIFKEATRLLEEALKE